MVMIRDDLKYLAALGIVPESIDAARPVIRGELHDFPMREELGVTDIGLERMTLIINEAVWLGLEAMAKRLCDLPEADGKAGFRHLAVMIAALHIGRAADSLKMEEIQVLANITAFYATGGEEQYLRERMNGSHG